VDSLQEVGAARSIVIDEDGRILAGNGTVEAAAEAGITRVQVVDADGETIVAVRRRGLTEEQKRRLALLDNRTAELAEWAAPVLEALRDDGLKLDDLFSDDELAAVTLGEVDVLGVPLGDHRVGENNLSRLTAGPRVGLQFGEIMVTLDRGLYERVRDAVAEADDVADAMGRLLERGLSC